MNVSIDLTVEPTRQTVEPALFWRVLTEWSRFKGCLLAIHLLGVPAVLSRLRRTR